MARHREAHFSAALGPRLGPDMSAHRVDEVPAPGQRLARLGCVCHRPAAAIYQGSARREEERPRIGRFDPQPRDMSRAVAASQVTDVLDPIEVIEKFGADPLRFYCFREVTFGADGSVSTAGFETRYETELANEYGNLASRTLAMIGRWIQPRSGSRAGRWSISPPLSQTSIPFPRSSGLPRIRRLGLWCL